MTTVRIIRTGNPLRDPDVRSLLDSLRGGGLQAAGPVDADIPSAVRDIIVDVARRGDQAVIDQTDRLEGVTLTPETLRVESGRIQDAHRQADADFLALIRRVIENIRAYQQSILTRPPQPLRRGGRTLSVRYTPIERVGVYVPGGRALYPSTVLMTVVPAQVAEVPEIALLSPPTREGDVSEMVLALAGELGIDEVYRVSGTPGVAAMALGTSSIPAVRKIVGPGNAFIAEAKRQLFGRVGIDSIAGPSEVLIIADASAPAKWIAADMLSQAEHDPGSAVLVTTSDKLAEEVALAVEGQIVKLERLAALRRALEAYSAILVVPDLDTACEVANEIATEHLQIITEDNQAVLAKVRDAGAVFLGPRTPVPLGDYLAGPSHVLPTGQTAKFFGPLSCNEFRKASSVVEYDATAFEQDAADVIDFATREGLTAHAAAMRIRLDGPADTEAAP